MPGIVNKKQLSKEGVHLHRCVPAAPAMQSDRLPVLTSKKRADLEARFAAALLDAHLRAGKHMLFRTPWRNDEDLRRKGLEDSQSDSEVAFRSSVGRSSDNTKLTR